MVGLLGGFWFEVCVGFWWIFATCLNLALHKHVECGCMKRSWRSIWYVDLVRVPLRLKRIDVSCAQLHMEHGLVG